MSPAATQGLLPDSVRQAIEAQLRALGDHMAQVTRAQAAGLDVADHVERNRAARKALTAIHAAYFAPLPQLQ